MTLATNVTLKKDVTFQIEARSKGEAKKYLDEMLDNAQMFRNEPEGDALFELLKAQDFDFRDLAAYDEEQIDSIDADGNEYEIVKVGE